MADAGLTLIAIVLFGGLAVWWWHRRRTQRLPLTARTVFCPVHEVPAHVSVRTDAGAQSCRQYVAVAGCSLLDSPAVVPSDRIAFLPDADFPLVTLRVPQAPDAAAEVACRQDCVFVLNEAAVCHAGPPAECTSGVNDAIELERQTSGNPRMARIVSYYGS